MPIDLVALAGANITTFFLVFARVGGMFALAPVFASRLVPMRIRLILAVAVSLMAAPGAAASSVPLEPLAIAPLMLKELLVGTAMAFGVAGVFAAVQLAGSLVDTTIGFGMAQVVDPTMNFSSTVLAQFYGLLATMVFLAIGGHLMLVGGVVSSFQLLPVDRSPEITALTSAATDAMAPVFVIAIEIAAPVVATLLLTDVGFGLLARLVPSLQPMALQFSVKILAGMGVMALALPFTVRLIGERFGGSLGAGGFLPGVGP